MYIYQRIKDLREDTDNKQAYIARLLGITQLRQNEPEGESEFIMASVSALTQYLNHISYGISAGEYGLKKKNMLSFAQTIIPKSL